LIHVWKSSIVLLYGMYVFVWIGVLVWLWPATKAPHGRPSPRWGVEEYGKKQAN